MAYWTDNKVDWGLPVRALEVRFDEVEEAFEVRRRLPDGTGHCIALRPSLRQAHGYADALGRVRWLPVEVEVEVEHG